KEEKEDSIKEFSSLLCEMVNRLYKSYNVFRQDPMDETQRLDGSLMVFQSRLNDPLTGDLHDKMYKLRSEERRVGKECIYKGIRDRNVTGVQTCALPI